MVKSNVLYMEGLNIYKGSKAASHVGMIPSNKKKKKKRKSYILVRDYPIISCGCNVSGKLPSQLYIVT